MNNLKEELDQALSPWTDEKGFLNRPAIERKAYLLDPELMKCLLGRPRLKAYLGRNVNGVYMLDPQRLHTLLHLAPMMGEKYTAHENAIGLICKHNRRFVIDQAQIVLNFPYKDTYLVGGQTKDEQKGDEHFWHDVIDAENINWLLKPKALTQFARIGAEGKQTLSDLKEPTKENWLIKGNNLLALCTLKASFGGKVKLIYIDPPYNTKGDANTFLYNNRFNHSSWLVFMKNRLQAARALLREDGIIAVSIDDYEQAYLKVLMDEVFGQDNFIGTVVVESNPGGRDTSTFFATSHEYCHFYAKSKASAKIYNFKLTELDKEKYNLEDEKGKYKLSAFRRGGGYSTPKERPNSCYPIYYAEETKEFSLEKKEGYVEILPKDSNGVMRVWRQTKPSFLKLVEQNDIVVKNTKNGYAIHKKDRLTEETSKKPKTMWHEPKYSATTSGTILLRKLLDANKISDGFSFPKSLYLMKDIIAITTKPDEEAIVLDFFAGSGTTGHAVMALNQEDGGNRRFILVEQMDYVERITCARLQKVLAGEAGGISPAVNWQGGGTFLYAELLQHNAKWVSRLAEAQDFKALRALWVDMQRMSDLCYCTTKEAQAGITALLADGKGDLARAKGLLKGQLDVNLYYVPYDEQHDVRYGLDAVSCGWNDLIQQRA